jgi:hypothetical protein
VGEGVYLIIYQNTASKYQESKSSVISCRGVAVWSSYIGGNGMLKDIKGAVSIEKLSEIQVIELQRRLGIQQTGIMGPMTRKAWEDWKRSKGMGEPGLIGPGSIGLLLEDIDWTDMTSKVSKYFTVREVTRG